MTPLRNNLESAKREYEQTRYRGNLALDVLGPPAAARPSKWSPLAIAAALAVGLGVGIFAGRSMRPTATGEIAKESPTALPAVVEVAITNPPTETAPIDVDTTDTPAVEEAFSVVPSAEAADEAFTIVPDLASLTSDGAAASTTDAVAFAPMSLMLLSADEYGEQQAAIDAANTNTSGSSDSPSSTSSEERS